MAAMTLEPRDPDMSHFIDQYKFERQMEERRDKFGGGTSLPLNSDGYEDRKRFLREERYKDWVEQQEKDINYKHTINPYPHPKLTSGPQNTSNYDVEIQKMTDRYNNQYDDVLVETDEQQRKQEQDRLEQRRRIQQPPAQPQGHQIDYNQAHELTKAEDRRAYQDYQGKMTIPMEGRMHVKPPVSYEENKKLLAEERKREYGQWQDKKAKEERYRALRGRTVTPPGQGLDIGKYDRQVKEQASQKKKEYKDMLDQQQKEQMFMKAQQEPEMSVIDRKPPPGPSYRPREEAFQTNTYPRPRSRGQQEERGYVPSLSDAPVRGRSYDERSRPPPRELLPPRTPPRQTPPPPRSPRQRSPPPRTPPQRTSGRNFEDPLEQLRMQPRSPSRRSPPPRTPPPPREMDQLNQNTSRQPQIDLSPRRHKYSDMEESQYDRMRKIANLERKEEYERYLKQKAEDRNHHKTVSRPIGRPAEVVKGHYYDSDNYESYQHELRKQQLDDYREYLKKGTKAPRNRNWKDSENGLLLPEDHSMEYKKRELQAERKREYNEHLAQKKMQEVPRRDDYGSNVSGPYNGMFQGLGEHGNQKDVLSQQRRQEYNEQYSQREKPQGRPSWAKDPVMDEPGDVGRQAVRSPAKQPDNYEQMLQEKRREEAQRRRFDDPEYQDKLARMDSRDRRGPGLDQPRYGY